MDVQNFFRCLLILLPNLLMITAEYKRICFYGGWAMQRDRNPLLPENIDPYLCTHIVYAFATLDSSGTEIKVPDGFETEENKIFRKLNAVRHKNKDVDLILSVGGWVTDSKLFSKLVSSEDNMQKFASGAIHYLRKHDFDGLDLSWEYPTTRGSPQSDVKRFYDLIRLIKWEFEHEEEPDIKKKLTLSLSVDPTIENANRYYDLVRFSRYLDFVNMQTFDMYGPWNYPMFARHHSALISSHDPNTVNNIAKYWVQNGIPPHKIVLGIAAYGRSYQLADPTHSAPGAKCIGPGMDGGTGYPISHLCHFIKNGVKERIIADKRVPYMVIGDEWIGYDNPASVKQKAEIVFRNFLGGVMVWTIDQDDYNGSCGNPYPILNAVVDGLHARHSYMETIIGSKQDMAQVAAAKKEIYRQRKVRWNMQDAQLQNHRRKIGSFRRYW